ncbi:MAG: Sigma-70, region 4 [Solirubrobacterales bacterium]|jgi:RNA polymerase sigma factor (sigma-70 family)|nr:Sigma-70, region 4 [Solirubrobacterales bacterium]
MMYRPSEDAEPTGAQMERARSVFIGWLWRGNLSADFIHNHADDLLGEAHGEYVKAVRRGEEIEDPVGWTVFCAWRRTNRRLERGPEAHEFASEKLPELADPDAPTPEGEAEERDRVRKIREAVRQLRRDQQQVIALTYFEGQTLRDAAKTLGWGYGTAYRRYKSAVEKLEKHFRAMGIESSDDLWIEIGVVASLVATGPHQPFHVHLMEMAADKAEHLTGGAWETPSHLAADAWARVQDLARRFNLGGSGDAAGVVASSGAGRTAGVCATAVVACVVGASGAIGPGIGLFEGHSHSGRARADVNPEPQTTSRPAATAQVKTPTHSSAAADGSESGQSRSTTAATSAASHAPVYGAGSPSDLRVRKSSFQSRIEEESGVTSETSSSSAPATTSSAPASATTSAPSPSGSSSASRAQATQQFGTIR